MTHVSLRQWVLLKFSFRANNYPLPTITPELIFYTNGLNWDLLAKLTIRSKRAEQSSKTTTQSSITNNVSIAIQVNRVVHNLTVDVDYPECMLKVSWTDRMVSFLYRVTDNSFQFLILLLVSFSKSALCFRVGWCVKLKSSNKRVTLKFLALTKVWSWCFAFLQLKWIF